MDSLIEDAKNGKPSYQAQGASVRKQRRSIFIFMMALFFLSAANLQASTAQCDDPASPKYDWNICAGETLKSKEKQLNHIVEKLKAKVSPAGQRKLSKAQKSWETYRKDQCDFETFGLRTGSAYSSVYANCLSNYTSQQGGNLLRQLNCEEGFLSCGNQ